MYLLGIEQLIKSPCFYSLEYHSMPKRKPSDGCNPAPVRYRGGVVYTSWATKPANTNTVRVPGFDALRDEGGPFLREAIAKF